MKNLIFTLLTVSFLFSCGGGSGTSSDSGSKSGGKGLIAKNFNYKMFSDEAELKKIADGILAKAGDNISKLDKIDAWITRPSKEGSIKRDKPDYATITLTYLDPNDPKKLFEYRYDSDDESWSNGESKQVRLISGNAETFVLANEVYDASGITSDIVVQTVKEAWNKYKDEAKYSDQWVRGFVIKGGEISVSIKGILAANDLEKSESYKKKIGK
jgi:hypothetical protein